MSIHVLQGRTNAQGNLPYLASLSPFNQKQRNSANDEQLDGPRGCSFRSDAICSHAHDGNVDARYQPKHASYGQQHLRFDL